MLSTKEYKELMNFITREKEGTFSELDETFSTEMINNLLITGIIEIESDSRWGKTWKVTEEGVSFNNLIDKENSLEINMKLRKLNLKISKNVEKTIGEEL